MEKRGGLGLWVMVVVLLIVIKGPREKHVYILLTVFVVTVVVRWIVCNIVGI